MRIRPFVAALTGAALLLSAATSAHAESTAYVGDGQKITGTVPVGEIIRLTMPLPAGGIPRLNLTLKGSKVPLSFLRSDLYDPNGNLIPDTSRFFEATRIRANKSTLKLREFVAPTSGEYQLVIETNSERLPNIVELRANGKLRVQRVKKIKERFSTAGAQISFGLQVRDKARATVSRVNGDKPEVAAWITPAGTSRPPPQKRTKKGGVAGFFTSTRDDIHSFEFGYRDDGSVGEYMAIVRIKPVRSAGGVAVLRLANAPGIPLSVRTLDRSIFLNFGTGAPGLSYDGTVLLASALDNSSGTPEIAVRVYDRDLFAQPVTPTATPVVGALDMQPGQSLGGHRIIHTGNHHVLLWWTASGANAGLVRFSRTLLRTNFREVIVGSGTPIVDPFLASDGNRISVGIADIPFGHRMRVYEQDFSSVGAVDIGGGPFTHGNGANAVWIPSNVQGTGSVFQLWAPDSLDPTQPSDLHRQSYTALWVQQGTPQKPIADPTVTETMSTAVSYDVETGVTIVHYVVPEDLNGDGVVHRAVFDASGDLVPGSHVALPGDRRNRPTTVIAGGSLFLGTSSPDGPLVERYQLLR